MTRYRAVTYDGRLDGMTFKWRNQAQDRANQLTEETGCQWLVDEVYDNDSYYNSSQNALGELWIWVIIILIMYL